MISQTEISMAFIVGLSFSWVRIIWAVLLGMKNQNVIV